MTTDNSISRVDKIKYLKPDELASLLALAKKESIRDYAILYLAYQHGLRASEVGLLKLNDVDETSKRIHVNRVKGGISATYKTSDECFKALKNWLQIRGKVIKGKLFPTRACLPVGDKDKGYSYIGGISRRQLDTLFKYYAVKAGIPGDKQHFHTLRHTIAVEMVEKAIPLVQIQDWLGHKSIQSTIVYAKVSDKARDTTANELFGKEQEDKKVLREGKIDWSKDRKKR